MQRGAVVICPAINSRMKIISVLLLLSSIAAGCKKNTDGKYCDTYLSIISTTTPGNTTLAQGITSIIKCTGPNLCYSFTDTEVLIPVYGGPGPTPLLFDIRAKGKMPCSPKQICAQAIFQASDTVNIHVSSAGTYYLRFYNNANLFKIDTVVVN